MKDGFSLYYICIVPPENISAEIVGMQMQMAENYQSKSALRSPPHITLHMPFRWKPEKEERLFLSLEEFCKEKQAISVKIDGFGAFPPRVIYANVPAELPLIQLQKDLARHCKQQLQLFNSNYRDSPYHPHMTLAFRDLKAEAFKEAYAGLKHQTYSRNWECQHICLMKNMDKRWHIYRVFELAKSTGNRD